MLETLDNN